MEMNADSKRKPRQSDRILAERARRHKRRRSTTPLKTPFRHPTPFPSNSPLHLLRITTERLTANGSKPALDQKQALLRSTSWLLQ
jgi:hypothetical protein